MDAIGEPATPQNQQGPPSGSAVNGDNDRDRRGRFTVGNKASKGNPYARKTAALRAAFMRVLTPDAMRRIAERLVMFCEKGDIVCGPAVCKLVLAYGLGKPGEALIPDGVDFGEAERELEKAEPLATQSETPSPKQPAPPQTAEGLRLVAMLADASRHATLPADKALEAAKLCRDLLLELHRAAVPLVAVISYLAPRLRALVEKAGPAAVTDQDKALLAALSQALDVATAEKPKESP
ncbi:MAG: hypothetical protein HYS12_23520 [Planctomycetes bacterium]|nr:hypothetical protein [Planctomycetota bacterium]